MIEGIIFDMDGVISDTQILHSKVESKLLSKYGIEISPEEITEKYSGVKTKEFFESLLKNQQTSYDLDSIMEEKWKQDCGIYLFLCARRNIPRCRYSSRSSAGYRNRKHVNRRCLFRTLYLLVSQVHFAACRRGQIFLPGRNDNYAGL